MLSKGLMAQEFTFLAVYPPASVLAKAIEYISVYPPVAMVSSFT